MSYYYNYYIGYKKDGKIYPLGPYDANGKIYPVVSRSKSFASDLYTYMWKLDKDEITDELRKEFEYTNYKDEKVVDVKYRPLRDLPTSNYIKSGYFLIEDIQVYEQCQDATDLFYDKLTPQEYIVKMERRLKFGPELEKKDDEGNVINQHDVSDYAFYMYPDYNGIEYEVESLRNMTSIFQDFLFDESIQYVVLETEG